MKKIRIILTFIFITINAFPQSQSWQWIDRIGGHYEDFCGSRIDNSNNIYLSGYFMDACYFQHDTLQSWGINDLFLEKYDENGYQLWIKKIGGYNFTNFEYPGGFSIDKVSSSLYYSCSFYSILSIPPFGAVSNGESDIVLAKFDIDGNCLWLKHIGSYLFDDGGSVATDCEGNIYWMGRLESSGSLDTFSVPAGTFLSKLDQYGNVLWVRHEITEGSASWINVAPDEILMAGITYKDTCLVDTVSLISDNEMDCFIAKLHTDGSAIWAKRFGGYGIDYPGSFIIDRNRNIYLVGIFNDSMTVDGVSLVNKGRDDMFLAKLDSNGNLDWIQQSNASGTKGASCFSVEMNFDSTSFYIAGTFSGNAQFGTINANSSTEKDVFVAKYNLSGQCLGLNHFGEADYGEVHLGSDGKLLISGMFSGELQIGSTILTSLGNTDIFLAKSDTLISVPEDDQKRENGLTIYANPTTSKCNITIPEEFINEDELVLRIYDQMGKLVQEVKVENVEGTLRFDIRAQAKGLYHATLSNGRKVYSGKIVFE